LCSVQPELLVRLKLFRWWFKFRMVVVDGGQLRVVVLRVMLKAIRFMQGFMLRVVVQIGFMGRIMVIMV